MLCPPFVMTDAQMDEMFGKLGAALDEVFDTLADGGLARSAPAALP